MKPLPKKNKNKYEGRLLCPVPVDKINAALGTELEPGHAWLSATAHRHMALDHPGDYPICITHLEAAISAPTYIGQAAHHPDNIEIIKRIRLPSATTILVALSLTRNEHGNYNVRSSYLIEEKDVDARRRARRLKAVL